MAEYCFSYQLNKFLKLVAYLSTFIGLIENYTTQFSLFMCGFHLSEQAEERKPLEWMTAQLLELEPSELRVDIIFS